MVTLLDAEQLMVDWLVWLRDVRGRADRTLRVYNQVLRAWLDFTSDLGVDPLDPSVEELEAFTMRLRNRRKPKPATQSLDATVMIAWFKWLTRRHVLAENPAENLMLPKVPRTEGRPIEDVDWEIIWESDLPPRFRATLGFGFYCGLRSHELMELQCDQITPNKLIRFTRKGGGKDTTDWLGMAQVHAVKLPHLLPDIDEFTDVVMHVKRKYTKLTPWQPSASTLLRAKMRKLCVDLRIPAYTVHQLRHSAVTNLLRAEVPLHLVSRLMNHGDIKTTMRYVRAGGNELREWLSRFEDPSEPGFEVLEHIEPG